MCVCTRSMSQLPRVDRSGRHVENADHVGDLASPLFLMFIQRVSRYPDFQGSEQRAKKSRTAKHARDFYCSRFYRAKRVQQIAHLTWALMFSMMAL